jgi:stage III sporulation protein AG
MSREKIRSVFQSLWKDDRKRNILLIAGIALIALIFFSSFFGEPDTKESTVESEQQEEITMDQYVSSLENRIVDLLNGIEGVGNARVMVTLESSSEYVYQSEVKSSSDVRTQSDIPEQQSENREENIVLVEGEDGQKQALIRTERTPKIQGVVVVCDGADDINVQAQIIDVVKTAFGISSARVSVAKAG